MTARVKHLLTTEIQIYRDRILLFSRESGKDFDVAIHEIRKAIKRLRALHKLMVNPESEPGIKTNAFLRRKGKKLASSRDAAMFLEFIEEKLSPNPELPNEILDQLRHSVETVSGTTEFELKLKKFSKKLDQGFQKKLDQVDIAGKKQFKNQLHYRLSKGYESSFSYYKNKLQFKDSKQLHELRKQLKNLYYQFDFLKACGYAYFEEKAKQLDWITELLGDEHDCYLFQKFLKAVDLNPDESKKVSMVVQSETKAIRKELKQVLPMFYMSTPNEFATESKDILL